MRFIAFLTMSFPIALTSFPGAPSITRYLNLDERLKAEDSASFKSSWNFCKFSEEVGVRFQPSVLSSKDSKSSKRPS